LIKTITSVGRNLTAIYIEALGTISVPIQLPYLASMMMMMMMMMNWHSAGSLGWPFPVLKYEYIFM